MTIPEAGPSRMPYWRESCFVSADGSFGEPRREHPLRRRKRELFLYRWKNVQTSYQRADVPRASTCTNGP
jgi:hypothetical protein